MANAFDLSGLTLNPKEVESVRDFIVERVYSTGELNDMYNVFENVVMKSQIIQMGQLGLTGVEASSESCEYATSGATAVATQKYWEPAKIEDLFTICMAQVPALMKAFFNKAKSYRDLYDIQGSDEMLLLVAMVEDAIKQAISRLIWFGDTNVAAATSSAAGLKVSTDAKFYNPIDGFFVQLADGVTAGTVNYVDISAQQGTSITAAQAYADIMSVYKNADSRVRGAEDGAFYVSGDIYIGLMEYAVSNSLNFEFGKFENGIQTLKFLGHTVYNMENQWRFNALSFVNNTTDNDVDRPTRIVFTTKSNLGVATLNTEDFTTIDSWYSKDDRQNKTTYGFTIDAKVLDETLATVAW